MKRVKFLVGFIAVLFITSILLTTAYNKKEQFDIEARLFSNQSKSGLVFMNSNLKSYKVAIVVYIPFRSDKQYVTQFSTMLFGSWKYIYNHTNFDLRQPNLLVKSDILVWCHIEACMQLPSECVKYNSSTDSAEKSSCRCLWFTQHEHKSAQIHGYINSFMFAQSFDFYKIADTYDYILRTDVDVFLTPAFVRWIPVSEIAFSQAYYCTAFNMKRLEEIAAKLQLINQGVHCIGSTVYMTPSVAKIVGNLIVNLTVHLVENEFRPELPGLEKMFIESVEGVWPTWWRGVSTLYATELALNHVVPNISKGFAGQILDVRSCENVSIAQVTHIHCYHDSCEFGKFSFMRTLMSMQGTLILDPRLFRFYKDKDVFNMTVRDYSTFIAWHSAANYLSSFNGLLLAAQSVA